MQILTSAEMAATDRRTAEEFGVPLPTLMENAGTAVARFCLSWFATARQAVVLCGKGNNGGDGFVAARVLAEAGVLVQVVLLGRADKVKGEAAGALRQLREEASSVALHEVVDEAALRALEDVLGGAELIVDAVVGTGFKPPLRGLAVVAREMIAGVNAPVVAVDLPSGSDADATAQTAEGAYRADAVVTFTAPKMAHVFGHLTRATFGPVVVAGIGSPEEAVVSASGLSWAGAAKAIAEQPRDINSNKGKYGHVLVVGGSYGTAGAPSMASLAALRAGAGLVTAAVPKSILDLVAGIAPELMMAPLKEGAEGEATLENLTPDGPGAEDGLEALIRAKKISVVALGPGLSTRGEASAFARELVAKIKLPMVIDADGLNAFDGRAAELNGQGRVMVLTPHPGEMARLAGLTIKEVEADRIGLARRFATEHQLTLVLKGWRTLVAHPDGRIAVNTSGNPAMAKGGSGDILTGIVAAMLAQFPCNVAEAIEAAVYLHGLAGDFAACAMDEHTVLATDTVAHLSDAFRYRAEDADGLTWICGLNDAGRAQ
ncbi:MAG: NAD(P)H-hydrate dehydratase [Acidobacteriaceae bacterium]|jgi:NAD(P)H-hydrate epimerase